jgi:glyoxylase-like metal-dependent hydrolase (beta-lactamase superfamily II)
MEQPQQPEDLNIPHSNTAVEVSIIDTTSHLSKFPSWAFVEPSMPGFDEIDVRSYAFLIKRYRSGHKYDTLLFDLGVRKDWHNCPTSLVEAIKQSGSHIEVQKDISTILEENGQSLADIGGVIWSHWHFDHAGNPALFPGTTNLIVGPGFRSAFVPAFPTVVDSQVDERAWEGRELHELNFEEEGKGLKIGKFQAIDVYGDGSFYFLNTPGHTVGHVSALARTTVDPPTFIFMGGDIAHHSGEFRPTKYMPLPQEIAPNQLTNGPRRVPHACPGEMFLAIHPKKSRTEPFFYPTTAAGGWHHCPVEATRSIDKMTEFDAYDNIFPVIAHDNSLIDIVDFYPKKANDWQSKGWKDQSRWGFLSSFDPGSEGRKLLGRE